MELDLGAAVDSSTRRKMDATSEAVEITPLEMYDSARAKIAANLRWLFAKAYGIDQIPEEMRDPFYTDQYGQEQIKPPVIRLLLSSELYCRVCGLILKGDQVASLQSLQSVIQALSHKGIYVMEGDLMCQPIKMSSHMLMIDALMMVYTVEMISIEKVVTCVKHFSTFRASRELPFDLEDAMIFWVNKVNLKMREISEKEYKVKQHLLDSPSHQEVLYRREHASGRQLPHFTLLEDLMRDVCDGAALLTVVHYYCPDLMKLDDICLKEVTSIADRLCNIQLLKEFANDYLNKCFYLTLEDMLYLPLVLKQNVMVFIAELFWWFEIVKLDFVHPRDVQDLKEARAVIQSKISRPSVPISNATKRSFLVSPGMADSAHPVPNIPEVCNSNKGNSNFSPSHPLLPLRQRQQKLQQIEGASGCRNHSNVLMQESHPRRSVVWSEKRQRPLSWLNRYVLHCSTDSDAYLTSDDSASLTYSSSEDSLASTLTPKHQGLPSQSGPRRFSDHGNLGNVNVDGNVMITVIWEESSKNGVTLLNSGDVEHQCATASANSSSWGRQEEIPADSRTASFYLDPLVPAVLKPTKEKSICLNKEEESGEGRQHALARKGCAGYGPSSSARRRPPHLHRTYDVSSISELIILASEPKNKESVPPSAGQTHTFRPIITSSVESSAEQSPGFYRHSSSVEDKMPVQVWGDLSDKNTETVGTIENQERQAKEKPICLNKVEESGERRQNATTRKGCVVTGPCSSARRRPPHLNRTYNVRSISELITLSSEWKTNESLPPSAGQTHAFRPIITSSVESSSDQSPRFYLHLSAEDKMPLHQLKTRRNQTKRDEARRKANEDWIRKEEEKARQELIKQEYLKRKQELSEEQEQTKTKPKPKPIDTVPKCTPANENLISAKSGSNLSLVSVATTEADSVNSGGAGSQRGESVELFSVLSRTKEHDWDNGSTVSSITSTSMAEYTRPKLFKEPNTKSNKPIIHNALSHCCLAGRVNEPQKNSILEEIQKCKLNHLMILFRDGACQFRALYSYLPDTEEIHKLTGTGPKSITKKMIDKLYKYSSDRKQFTVIPAKTVSVSVDALTIHNHLWKAKRSAVPKKSAK